MKILAVLAFALSMSARGDDGADAWRRYYHEDVKKPFFAHDAAGRYDAARPGADAAHFRQPKAPGTLRVFVVGGSIAQRYASFPGNLGDALRAALSGVDVEFIGCGMAGYDSEREAPIVDEIAGYSPDLIVLMTGHNENNDFRSEPWLLRRVPMLSSRSGRFEANLKHMISAARSRSVPILVITPPLNWSDQAPNDRVFYSEPLFIEGWIRYVRSDPRGAISLWTQLLASTHDAEWDTTIMFYLGRAEERLGDVERANADYEKSILETKIPPFCGAECRETISRDALGDGALWADVDAAVRAVAAPRLPGLEIFQDAVHWSKRYNPVVSGAMIKALRASAPFARLPWRKDVRAAALPPSPGTAGEDRLNSLRYALVDIGTHDVPPLAALPRIERSLSADPKLFRDPVKLFGKLMTFENKGKAWGMNPPTCTVSRWLWMVGVARLELGDPQAARRDLLEAAKREPSFAPIRMWLGIAEALAGDARGAAAIWADGAVAGLPSSPTWKFKLGL